MDLLQWPVLSYNWVDSLLQNTKFSTKWFDWEIIPEIETLKRVIIKVGKLTGISRKSERSLQNKRQKGLKKDVSICVYDWIAWGWEAHFRNYRNYVSQYPVSTLDWLPNFPHKAWVDPGEVYSLAKWIAVSGNRTAIACAAIEVHDHYTTAPFRRRLMGFCYIEVGVGWRKFCSQGSFLSYSKTRSCDIQLKCLTRSGRIGAGGSH